MQNRKSGVGLGLVSGISTRLFTGYVIPNQIVFNYRFIIYGIGSGLMIGMLMFLIKSLESNSFSIYTLIFYLLVSIPIGAIITGTLLYLGFRNLKKRTKRYNENQELISDHATYSDSSYKTYKGRLVLANEKLIFYETTAGDCIFEYRLNDLNPKIKLSRFLNIPNGFCIKSGLESLNVAFPYYWIELIKNRK